MKATLTAMATVLAATAAGAQDLPQADSQWYTDAQGVLNDMIERQQNTNRALNVILFVADGNGVGTNYATRIFAGQAEGKLGEEHVLPYETYPNLALAKTYNINAQTPDSAPTAGAMNTGVKQVFNTINLSEEGIHDQCESEEGNKLTTFAELASDAGKSVGIVTSARITHATPAAVFAKTANRNWEGEAPEGCSDIATQLLESMQSGVVDIALGGGARAFAPEGTDLGDGMMGSRADDVDLVAMAKEAGAAFAYNLETLQAINLEEGAPVLGLFGASHMSYEVDRPESEPSLVNMVETAIEYLSNNEDGFYLEIESGRVDHANHAGNAYRALTDGVEFANAVALADEMTDDSDTLIIVTADHEHSIAFNGYCGRGTPILGLCMDIAAGQVEHSGEPVLADDGLPYTVIGYLNGPGSVLKPEMDADAGSEAETAADVQASQPTDEAEAEEPQVPVFSGSRGELTQEDATDIDYLQQALIPKSSESHSGEDVAIYAKGPWAHLIDGTVEQNYIFHVMHHAAMGADQ
ncbi:alkaline phosphatase [Tropicimonas sp. IMCC34011]|uniref:alkaline phosphatase n=1 Tax=Tropicimonas sp. IMCC34011 TaxID=2248759 RepID=UPI000E21E6CA|nr:alkaline phosphatase [Tropicimonas sp. IMCC34011]